MTETQDPDDPERALLDVRRRFVATFDERIRAIERLTDDLVEPKGEAAPHALRTAAHQLAGLAGTVGFPSVSARASALEQLAIEVSAAPIDRPAWRTATDALRDAFRLDEAAALPREGGPVPAGPGRIMVVEDDPEQRTLMLAWLTEAGYRPIGVASAEDALATATERPPDAIILDVQLPGVDGYALCRAIKASALSYVPVMFVTTRAAAADRALAKALGADDYLEKPVDAQRLTLRLAVMLDRRKTAPASVPAGEARSGALLSFEAFLPAARDILERSAVSMALIRMPDGADVQPILSRLRAQDLAARYRGTYLLLLLPNRSAGQVVAQLRHTLDAVQGADGTLPCAGVVGTGGAGQLDLESLLAEADEALARTRQAGSLAGTRTDVTKGSAPRSRGRIVVAEDDPEVTRLVDAQLRAAGYETTLCRDGRSAVDAVIRERPNLLILDLMMPDMTGLDVLEELGRQRQTKPRVLVLSASGRADDVRRAVGLGADDYVVKPFRPIEIAVRVRRLLS